MSDEPCLEETLHSIGADKVMAMEIDAGKVHRLYGLHERYFRTQQIS